MQGAKAVMENLARWLQIAFFVFSLLWLSSCATVSNKFEGDTDSLENLQKLNAPPPQIETPKNQLNEMRAEALRDVAISLGAQSGLHWRSEKINQLLKTKSKTLDMTYNFNALILEHNVLPPVLTEAQQVLNLDGPNTIRLADQTYEMVSQAKFVTTAPTWRDYLWMYYPQPPIPDKGILPHNKMEKQCWQKFSHQGWQKGIEQADQIYSENLSRLERDYKGMLLYQKLRAQHMVSAPFVARKELGITGGGTNLNINDQVLTITALPALQPNGQRWKPVLSKEMP